ncbi:hypothetical protein BJ322DRAFT_1107036 [Thelephora terrestris]|uniref:Uncharacterized protein n=1 Tax=Thelephora terrestris TaxID=56493 RepID=A0A9P6HH30_9AGAM|nr:hypothetical protein BJ322DRAFT_1107036 [Thelephora terrestris]
MHSALLVDELLQEVFNLCCSGNEYRKTLVQLARCCQAWKEPALRKAWETLPCVTPLMDLFTMSSVSPEEFSNYARMVKHVRLGAKTKEKIALGASVYDTTPLFPNLQSVAVLMDGCAASAVHLLLSPMLSTVTIDIGVSTGRATGAERSGNIATYLSSLRSSSIPTQKLCIRGFACEKLNAAVSSLSTLKSLSLKVGTSLSTRTVADIANFPFLEELFVHADRVDADSLEESLASSSPVFPNIRTLDIRSSIEVAATILRHARSTTFTKLSIEVTRNEGTTWTRLYSVIPTTVQDIHIDYHIDLDEPTSDTTDTNNDHSLTIGKLEPLSKLTLRAFTLDTNIPVNLADKDVGTLTRWWPTLKILDLIVSAHEGCKENEDQEAQMISWTPKLTLGCLSTIAKDWPHLEHLRLPINLAARFDQVQVQDFPVHTRLREFRIDPSLPCKSRTPLIDTNIAFIRNLFPSARNDFSVSN